jgi:hypothetical protein
MFTTFDFIRILAALGGLILGGVIGSRFANVFGAILGAAAGAFIGLLAGRLPFLIAWAWLRADLRRASVSQLRSRIETQYFISHLLIAELLRRREPLESFREPIVRQLRSESPDVRRFGLANARLLFPELVTDQDP